jgi:hypothetical protein
MKIEPGYDELGRQPPQDGFGRLHGFLVRFCFRRWKGGVSAVQERLPERSGDPLGEGLSGWVTGGLRQLLARYCDYCFKPGFFAKYRFCMVVYVQEMSPWPQKFFIVKRRPYSQAGRWVRPATSAAALLAPTALHHSHSVEPRRPRHSSKQFAGMAQRRVQSRTLSAIAKSSASWAPAAWVPDRPEACPTGPFAGR